MDFADWLEKKRIEKKWSKSKLARMSGQVHSTISDVISRKRKPTYDLCVSVARALEISDAEVLFMAGLFDDMPPGPLEPWVYDLVQESRSLTPQQRQHLIALVKMMQDGTVKLLAMPDEKAEE